MRTYSDNKYIYSVDMMIAYTHTHKMEISQMKSSDLFYQLKYNCWGDPVKNIKYAPLDVIKNPKKYIDDYAKIHKANLKYPIIVSFDSNIVDGMHRLTKTYLQKDKYVNAYLFDKPLMQKFIIGKKNEWNKVDKIKIYELIDLFARNFCVDKKIN